MLRVNHINVTVKKNEQPILKNISISINPNESIAILGASGSGKSTILQVLSGRLGLARSHKYSLEANIDGNDIAASSLGEHCLLLPSCNEHLPYLTVSQIISLEWSIRSGVFKRKDELTALMEKTKLYDHKDNYVQGHRKKLLTVYERKLLSLAIAYTSESFIMMFDEMTSYVSLDQAGVLFELLTEAIKSPYNKAAIVTLHQPTVEQLSTFTKVITLNQDGTMNQPVTSKEYIYMCKDNPMALKLLNEASKNKLENGFEIIIPPVISTPPLENRSISDESDSSNYTPVYKPADTRLCMKNTSHSDTNSSVSRAIMTYEASSCTGIVQEWFTKIISLFWRSILMRLQNPFEISLVIIMIVSIAILFGFVFIHQGERVGHSTDIPALPDDVQDYLDSWLNSVKTGFGPNHRFILDELPWPKMLVKDSKIRNLNAYDTQSAESNIDKFVDNSLDSIYCLTHYWRLKDRFPYYQEPLPVVDSIFAENDEESGYVFPSVKPSVLFDSYGDKLSLSLTQLLQSLDYVVGESVILDKLSTCPKGNFTIFYLCLAEALPDLDGLLTCFLKKPLDENHMKHSPYEDVEKNIYISDSSDISAKIQILLQNLLEAVSLGCGFVFLIATAAFSMFPIIALLWAEREAVNRETLSKSYNIMSYFIAKICADVPFDTLPVIIMVSIFNAMIGLHGKMFIMVIGVLVSLAWGHGGAAYMSTALFRKQYLSIGMFIGYSFVSLIFSGFLLRVPDMPIWCAWFRQCSTIYWAFGLIIHILFPSGKEYCGVPNIVIKFALGVTDEITSDPLMGIMALLSIGISFRIISFLFLSVLHRDLGIFQNAD